MAEHLVSRRGGLTPAEPPAKPPVHSPNRTSARGVWYDPLLRAGLARLSPAGPGARLSITIFHRVHAERDPLFPGEVDQQRFDQICAWLAGWFNVLPLDEACRRLADGSLPPRAMAITFDDGYADNCTVALPILRRHGLPATFFIATSFLDGGRMWNDTVIETVRRSSLARLDLAGLGLRGLTRVALDGLPARQAAIGQILGATKYLEPGERLQTVQRIARMATVADLPDDLMMSTEQLRSMAAAGMQIGAHTLSHPILLGLDDAQARDEIVGSKQALEQCLGQPITLFAYPTGRPGTDYSARDAALVRAAGFQAAVSTAPGAAQAGADVMQLPRFVPWEQSRLRWAAKLGRNLRQPGQVALA